MTIQIRDAALEARLQKQIDATGSSSVEELLLRLLESQEEQDRWLLENREGVNGKIQRGSTNLNGAKEFQRTGSTPTCPI